MQLRVPFSGSTVGLKLFEQRMLTEAPLAERVSGDTDHRPWVGLLPTQSSKATRDRRAAPRTLSPQPLLELERLTDH